MDLAKKAAVVTGFVLAIFAAYSAVGYTTGTLFNVDAATAGCSTCITHWIDGPNQIFNEPFAYTGSTYEPGGGGQDFYTVTPPPTPPQCTLELTRDMISWTTNYASNVQIVPLTNSPQVPGATTGGGGATTANHTETQAYESSAVIADMAASGINLPGVQGNTGFSPNQVTMNRVCTLLDGAGSTASNIGARNYNSPSDNYVVSYNGSSWIRVKGISSHMSTSFTCTKPANTSTYPLNGSHNFVPPLGVGTHTYQLTATGAGQVICQKTVVVPPPQYDAPTCTLSAYPFTIEEGESTSLTWVTANATSFAINQGVGSVSPVANGSKSVSPSVTTTYTGTATGPGGTVQCSKKITVTPPPPPPQGECKLKIEKSVSTTNANAGDEIEYTLTFKNIGGADCTGGGVKITDVVDPLLTFKSETHSGDVDAGYNGGALYTSGDRTLHWDANTLTPGESGWIKWKAKVGTPSACSVTVPNTAKITSLEYDYFSRFETSNTVNVTVTKDCTPPPPPEECKLIIDKSTNKTSVVAGDEVEYTLTFKNTGGSNCTGGGVRIVDVLDSGLTYKSETHSSNVDAGYGGDPVYTASSRTLHWNGNTLTPGEEGWVKFKVTVNTHTACSVTIPNKAKITSYEYNYFNTWVESNTVHITATKNCDTPILACTLSVSKSKIKPGESIFVSWTSINAVSGSINSNIGTASPVAGGSYEVFPSDDTTYVGTFRAANGDTVTCQAPVTIEKGGGGCIGNCGGGLNQPNVVLLNKPGDAPLAFVSLQQIPYTGFEAGVTLTILFWTAVGLLAAAAAYFVMGRGGVQFLMGSALQMAGVAAYRTDEYDEDDHAIPDYLNNYQASTVALAAPVYAPTPTHGVVGVPASQSVGTGIPELTDVIESRANAAGVLISPEATALAIELSKDRGEALRMFGDILNKALQNIPREDGWVLLSADRFAELASATPKVAPVATALSTPSVESILASVMTPPAVPTAAPVRRNVEMPMTDAADQAVVMNLARAILNGNRDQAYATAHTLDISGANGTTVMTIIATAFDQLYRARRHGTTTALTNDAAALSDDKLGQMVEAFAHGMDHGYTNAFTGLKLAIAQAFEARG